ncbi:MAG: hypothetical protein K6D94_04390, partial [Clostridiales bacterium]|nr:hypothetical protein [Clostridiales bacterium]
MTYKNTSIFISGRSAARLSALTAAALVIFTLFSYAVTDISDKVPELKADTFTVMALGDDAVNGAGLDSPKKDRVSALLAADMGGHDSAWGVAGGTTGSLLKAINTGIYDDMLKNASYIVVDAGVNDFLIPFVKAADDAIAAGGYDCGLAGFITDVYGQKTDSATYKNSGDILKLAANALNYSNPVWEGVSGYTENIAAIIRYLNDKAPQAQIFMLNVYNPFSSFTGLTSGDTLLDLKALTDKYIANMNMALNRHKYVGWTNVTVVDAYEILSQSGCTQAPADTSKAMPLPTKAGHQALKAVIAEEIGYPVISDIKGHRREEDIRRIAAWGMLDDIIYSEQFYPDSAVTRADWAYMICRLVGGQSEWLSNQSGLTDVKSSDPRKNEIYWAYSQRLIIGKGYTVDPEGLMTREMLANCV